ncbi:Uncharacterised protein [Bordetella pertussis]|nr:Uncharacterised protein [Bordetella pertussis]
MRGSSWRRLPAAALRGLTNTFSPRAACVRFRRSNSARFIRTSPRTSSTRGAPCRRNGTPLMVRMLAVTSSPVCPSPRVAAWASLPSS